VVTSDSEDESKRQRTTRKKGKRVLTPEDSSDSESETKKAPTRGKKKVQDDDSESESETAKKKGNSKYKIPKKPKLTIVHGGKIKCFYINL